MDEQNLISINQSVQIPLSELQFRFSTSSGPGGQHVNKSATKVTLLFDVAHSPSLDEATRERLLRKLEGHLNKEGVLQLHVQDSRSQHRNRETAVFRFQTLLADALRRRKRRRKTKIPRGAVEARLNAKRQKSQKKRDRGQKWSS